MDLQVKLVNDGYAQPYVSREISKIPDWAVWKNEAYAITAEPIVIVYNKNLVAESDIPRTRAELTNLLNKKPDTYRGKIASYDPEQSGSGFLFITRDARITKTTWDMVRAFARPHPAPSQLFLPGTPMVSIAGCAAAVMCSFEVIGCRSLAPSPWT